MTLKKDGQMNIEVKEGVLARRLGKDFKEDGFVPLHPGTYKISGPAEHGYVAVIVSAEVAGYIHVDERQEFVKQDLFVML